MERHIQILVPARTFTHFPRLPPELRCEIWLHDSHRTPPVPTCPAPKACSERSLSGDLLLYQQRMSKSIPREIHIVLSHITGYRLRVFSGFISPYTNLKVELFYWGYDVIEIFQKPSNRSMSFVNAMSGLQHLAIDAKLLENFSFIPTLMYGSEDGSPGENYRDLRYHVRQFQDLKALTIVDAESVSSLDESGGVKDADRSFPASQEENEAQRNLDGTEMVSIGREGKEEIIAWFEGLLRNRPEWKRPEWKTPELRFMRIQKSSNAS